MKAPIDDHQKPSDNSEQPSPKTYPAFTRFTYRIWDSFVLSCLDSLVIHLMAFPILAFLSGSLWFSTINYLEILTVMFILNFWFKFLELRTNITVVQETYELVNKIHKNVSVLLLTNMIVGSVFKPTKPKDVDDDTVDK